MEVYCDDHFIIAGLENSMLDVREDHIDFFIFCGHISEPIEMQLQHATHFQFRNNRSHFQIPQGRALVISHLQFILLDEFVSVFGFQLALLDFSLKILDFFDSLSHICTVFTSESEFLNVNDLLVDLREGDIR